MTPNKQNITDIVAGSQEGGKLNPKDEYSAFMLLKIDHNTQEDVVNVETLVEDFNYMINQLQAAVRALEPLVEG